MLWRTLLTASNSFRALQQDVHDNLQLLLCHQQSSHSEECGLHSLGLPEQPLYLSNAQQLQHWLSQVEFMLQQHEPRLHDLICQGVVLHDVALRLTISGMVNWQGERKSCVFQFKLLQGQCYDD